LVKAENPSHTQIDDYSESISDTIVSQITDSEGHPWRGNKNHTTNIGGDFYTNKVTFSGPTRKLLNASYLAGTEIRSVELNAPVAAISPNAVGTPINIGSSKDSIIEKGATAVARCKPTNSVADTSTFLGELIKDHLPRVPGIALWERKLKALVSVGDEFLNTAFGWAPLVSDVKSIASGIRHADSVLRQFERDSGNLVRRQYHFEPEKSTYRSMFRHNVPCWYGDSNTVGQVNEYLGFGDVFLTVETVKECWFSGGFTYYVPQGKDYREKLIRNALEADKVFGTNLTPETLWELTPWSWAIDWFSNAGDVVSNLSDMATYGLVMRYGYVMETSINRHTYSFVRTDGVFPSPFDIPDLVVTNITKQRYGANPFGFGLTWDGLNSFQLAIAAALGFSHSG